MRAKTRARAERDIRRSVGAAIQRRRLAHGLGIDALARAAGIDTSQMGKVLRGACGLSFYSLGRVADALGCRAADLLPER